MCLCGIMAEHLQHDLPNDQKDKIVLQSDPQPKEDVKTLVEPEEGKDLSAKAAELLKEEVKKSDAPKKAEEVVVEDNAPKTTVSKKRLRRSRNRLPSQGREVRELLKK